MNLKKSLLIALFSFGIAQSAFAETDSEKLERAIKLFASPDPSKELDAFLLFKQLAEQGIPEAQYRLGIMYDIGKGVAKSSEQATYWYTKAAEQFKQLAEQGNAEAQFYLSRLYSSSNAVTQNTKQAIYWLTKAAERGHVYAQFELGVMYKYGRKEITKNTQQAFHWFKKAAEQGNTPSQRNLVIMYTSGEGTAKNYPQAVYWYTKITDGSQMLVKHHIDMIAKSAVDEFHEQQNYSAAFPLFKQLAKHGYANIQYYLAFMYHTGKGITQNYQQAAYWYEKAAEQGIKSAHNNLGAMYEGGEGIGRDLSKAKYYYGLACDGGDNKGCENYAKLDKQGVK